MSIEAFRQAYAPERIGRAFGVRDKAYSKNRDQQGRGIHRGLDVREQNADRTASVVTDVIAITSGRVVYVGRPNSSIELTVVIDRGEGAWPRFESHSHMADVAVSVGQPVSTGTRLGRNARLNERPGLISGVHDHITFSDHFDGAWNLSRAEYDPHPIIRERLAAVAASSSRPLPPQEDTMTVSINLNGRHLLAVGQEFVSHHGTGSQAEITRKVMSVTDEEHRLNTAQFHDLLDGLGIPRWIVNVDNGQVWNPEKKVYEHNGVWSRQRELLAKLDELAKPPAAKS